MRSACIIAGVILFYTAQALLCKKYADLYPGKKHLASPVLTLFCGLAVALTALALAGFRLSPEPLTVRLGLGNAAALVGYYTFIILGAQTGPYSVLTVFSIAGGIVVPPLSAWLFFGDRPSLYKMLSIAVILLAVWMVSYRKQEDRTFSALFLPVCLLLALSNGAFGSLLDAQQRLTGPAQRNAMVAVSYAGLVAVSLVLLLIRERKGALAAMKQTRASLLVLLACAVTMTVAANLLVLAIRYVNTTVLYALENAGAMLLTVLASCLLFREKLSSLNIAGCAVMAAGMVGVALL